MRKTIKNIFLTLCLLVATILPLQALAANKDIVILYTNDIHCAIDDNESLAGLSQYKQDVLKTTPYVALVDAGDAIQGSPIGKLSSGEVFTNLMNAIGYDFAIPGNHEYDYGMERFLELSKKLNCGYYSCNFLGANGKNVLPAYKIMTFGETKVAFIGVTTPSSLSSSTPIFFQDGKGNYIYSFCEDLNGAKLYKQIQKTVDRVRKDVEYVILVAHLGVNGAQDRWSSVAVAQNISGVDVIIDGHSHEVNPVTIVQDKLGKDVLITQTGTKLQNIGQLTISADGKFTTKLVSGLQNKDAVLEKLIAQEKAAFEEILKQPLGEAVVPLYVNDPETGKRLVRSQECNMGNLVADAMRKVLNADVSFVNGGGIRKDIPQGVFTYKDFLEVLPFGNTCAVKEVTGQQFLDALEMGVRNLPKESGSFLQVSGISYEVNTSLPSNIVLDDKGAFVKVAGAYRVQNVKVAGKHLDLSKLYSVASNSYILEKNGDGMTMFKNGKVLYSGDNMTDAEIVIEFIQNHLNARVGDEYQNPLGEGRIRIK